MKNNKHNIEMWFSVIVVVMLTGCLGMPSSVTIPKTNLSNPVDIDSNWYVKCAKDGLGLHCWGDFQVYTAETEIEEWQRVGSNKIDIPITDPISFDLSSSHICAVSLQDSFCYPTEYLVYDALGDANPFPNNSEKISLTRFTNPTTIRAGENGVVCVISDLGVECVKNERILGYNLFPFTFYPYIKTTPISVPQFTNPTSLAVGENHACAIDTGGLKCWITVDKYLDATEINELNTAVNVPTDLSNPTQVAVGYLSTCVLDDLGVRCWGSSRFLPTTPILNAPTQLVWVGNDAGNEFCALDGDTVKCWDNGTRSQPKPNKTLLNPIRIIGGNDSLCFLDATGADCI